MGLFVYSCSVPWPFVLTSYWHLLWLIGWWWYQVFLPSYVGLTLGPMKIVHPRAPGIGCTETGCWGAAATPTFVRPQDASGEDNSDVYQEDQGVVHKIVPLCSLRACFLWQNVILLYLYIYIYTYHILSFDHILSPRVFFLGGADGLTHWDSTHPPPLRCQRWSARHPGIGEKLWSTCSSCCSWGPLTPSLLGFVAGSLGRVHLEKVKVKHGKSGLNSTFPSHSSAFDWVGIQLVSFGFERNLVSLDCIIFHSLPGLWHCDLENSWERWGLVAVGISGVSDVFLWTLKGRWWDAPKKAPRLFVCHPLLLVCVCVESPESKGISRGQQPIFLCCRTKLWKMWWKGSWTREPVPALCMGSG